MEREEISDRVAASVPIRAKLGKPIGGQATFGYKWNGKELVVEEKEAPVRKLLYEIFIKHKRKKTTADELNKMGYRTRSGSLFSDTTIYKLLRDSTAKGERIANYTKSLGEGKSWELKPKSDWVVTSCPAKVSIDIWNEIQYFSSTTVIKDANDLYAQWPAMAFEEKCSIIETITEKIVIGKEDISFSLVLNRVFILFC